MDLLDILNKNSGALNLLFSLVVAVATVFYAVLTKRLVRETISMREAQTEPSVAVRIEPHEAHLNFIMLVIENVGTGPAYDVRLDVAPDFTMTQGRMLSSLGIFKHGFRYLAPRQRATTFLTSILDKGNDILDPKGPFQFEVTARFRSAAGRSYEYKYPIDFVHLIGMTTLGQPPLHEIADQVKKIAESVGHLESGWKRLRVDTYTTADRSAEAREWEEYRNEQEREAQSASQQLLSASSPPSQQPDQSDRTDLELAEASDSSDKQSNDR